MPWCLTLESYIYIYIYILAVASFGISPSKLRRCNDDTVLKFDHRTYQCNIASLIFKHHISILSTLQV
jgi:hypothetical protein